MNVRGQTSIEFLILLAGAALISTFAGFMVYSVARIPKLEVTTINEKNFIPTCTIHAETAQITVNAQDDCCLYGAEVFVDGSKVGSCSLEGTQDTCVIGFVFPPGQHNITAQILDASGNKGICSTVYASPLLPSQPTCADECSPSGYPICTNISGTSTLFLCVLGPDGCYDEISNVVECCTDRDCENGYICVGYRCFPTGIPQPPSPAPPLPPTPPKPGQPITPT